MKKSLHLSTTFDQPDLLEDLVEKLAGRRFDMGFRKAKMPLNFEALETSSTETYVSGTISLMDNNEKINIPFITSFLFTCTKGKEDEYKLTWAASMS